MATRTLLSRKVKVDAQNRIEEEKKQTSHEDEIAQPKKRGKKVISDDTSDDNHAQPKANGRAGTKKKPANKTDDDLKASKQTKPKPDLKRRSKSVDPSNFSAKVLEDVTSAPPMKRGRPMKPIKKPSADKTKNIPETVKEVTSENDKENGASEDPAAKAVDETAKETAPKKKTAVKRGPRTMPAAAAAKAPEDSEGSSEESSKQEEEVTRGKKAKSDQSSDEPVAKKGRGARPKVPVEEEKVETEDEDDSEPKPEPKPKVPVTEAKSKARNKKSKPEAQPAKKGRVAKPAPAKAGPNLSESDDDEDEAEVTQPSPKASKELMNNVATDYSNIDFDIKEKFNMKIVTWNVAGLRALVQKNSNYFPHENADIICLNEIKCGSEDDVPAEAKLKGYHAYWNTAKGAGGVAILSKVEPISVTYDLVDSEFDDEKRLITAEFEKFFLISVYVVNAGRGLKTLDKRMKWNEVFDEYVESLDKKKPVIIAGDMNVSHQEIDLANPKSNKKSAGFTQEERDGFTSLLSMGFVDSFRHFYPDKADAYTYWTYMKNSRAKNVGWRLDYFVVSERFMKHVKDNVIRSAVLGSDHCPIVLFLDL